jgi:hypothetical protein
MNDRSLRWKRAVAVMVIGGTCLQAGRLCHAQNAPASGLSPDLQEVIKLSQARMPDDVIKNFIYSTGKSYQLNADDIIYLNNQGVSAGVISVLQTAGANGAPGPQAPATAPAPVAPPPQTPPPSQLPPAPTIAPSAQPPGPGPATPVAAPSSAPPQPSEVSFQYFHDQLAPYGTWINVGGVTYWRPDQAMALDPDWRPYYDMGQWVETDDGLYWQSDYTWGDIPFHYGRWVLSPGYGWLWCPDYTWGPAWVFWRQDEADGVIGWAPLPVGAVFVNGAFIFNGVAVGADFNFGLGDSCFTFVGYDHFHEPFIRMRGHEWAYHVSRDRVRTFYGHSVLRNDFRRDDHGRLMNYGIGRDRVEHLTRVEHASFEERNPVGDRNRLITQRKDTFHKPSFDQPHPQPGNAGTPSFRDQPAKMGAEKGHEPSGKVYRPPTNPGGQGQFQPGRGPGQPQGQGQQKERR